MPDVLWVAPTLKRKRAVGIEGSVSPFNMFAQGFRVWLKLP
jgi:hypothetical protein